MHGKSMGAGACVRRGESCEGLCAHLSDRLSDGGWHAALAKEAEARAQLEVALPHVVRDHEYHKGVQVGRGARRRRRRWREEREPPHRCHVDDVRYTEAYEYTVNAALLHQAVLAPHSTRHA